MKRHIPASLLALLLTACGGGGDDNAAPTDPKPAPPTIMLDAKPGKPLPVIEDVAVGDVLLPPRSVVRPDAATQAKLDEALAATNRLRREQGLTPFRYNESLAAYATLRAQEISTQQGEKIEHKRPNGQNPLDDSNFIGRDALAENIAARNSEAEATVQQWRESPHHYATIISKDFENLGIGYHYAAGSVWKHYWTQIFSGGSTRSIYRFIDPLSRDAAFEAVHNATQYDSAGRLTLNAPQDSASTTGISRNAYSLNLGREHRITLLPHQTLGWSYQTFGAISDSNGIPEAYLNVGKPFVPGEGAMQADYRGKMVGDLAQKSRVSADVAAHLDFGAQKTIALHVENATRDGTRDARLDFSDTLNWNGNTGRFESETGNARLYGGGEELGGQFSRAVGNEAYRGAYGAKKVQ